MLFFYKLFYFYKKKPNYFYFCELLKTHKTHKMYKNNIKKYTEISSFIKKRQKIVSIFRFFAFVSSIFLLFFFINKELINIGIIVSSILMITFFGLLKYHVNLKNKNKFYTNLIKINEDELDFLDFKYSEKYEGNDFLDFNHPYIYDLDLIGEHSLFQYINRTSTSYGIKKLVNWLKIPTFEKQKIESRQTAVKELMQEHDLRQKFQAFGMLENDPVKDKDGLIEWISSPNTFSENKVFNILKIVLPAITFLLIILSFFKPEYASLWGISFLLNLGVLAIYYKKIKEVHNILSKKTKLLEKYIKQLELIENKQFKSKDLQVLQQKLFENNISANSQIRKLIKILNAFDTRFNVFLTFILNGLFLFDFWVIIRLEKWKKANKTVFQAWFEALGKFDALQSIATFGYNNSENICFPECNTDNFVINAKDMGHPLIPENERVNNDFEISDFHQFNIVTGANMAGKSTFLRTIGVNLILAMAGSPVIASKFEFYPVNIRTRIKISDSLFKNESYFYAELKRLKEIIEDLESGKEVFILLDEILRGTNSKDKHEGSKKYIEKLLNYKSSGIIATHDLILGKLQDEYGEKIKNFCFEVEIEKNNLIFDYKLKNGISSKLNASFLMKQMRIIDN